MTAALPLRHFLLALAVVAVWGTNFVVIRLGLDHLPPLLFAALRFTLAAIPFVFLFRRPPVSWRNLALYGLFIGVGQFGLMFIAMRGDISPGLASLVVQMNAFFTVGLAAWLARERVRLFQVTALAIAAAGIGLIVWNADAHTTPLGLTLVLAAALAWAGGNMVVRSAGAAVNMVAYVAWSSLFAAPVLFVLAFAFEGWPAIRAGVVNADLATWAAVVWQSVGNSLFGYAAWGWLLTRYNAGTIAPLSLLVPVFGMGASALWLAEPLPGWKLAAAALVMGGLALNTLGPRMWPKPATA
ncbi:MAG: EamA family transporter [Caulobacteraceae bacterium]|nr:EamA family transporter [Caulobacteraceae bacterium]